MMPEFLNTGKAFSITKKDRDEMTKKINAYAKTVGVAPDRSLMSKMRDAQKSLEKKRSCKGRDGDR